ncbi:MAG: hypothetical protein PG978_000361 [Wolbachia endosymbiont of Ctenocephalides felis wCfeF]|nr:MAG: hypothetical protein PG978_000361 [Wolbachia endosymbiont of Ctenocephalides felis wCfeF]
MLEVIKLKDTKKIDKQYNETVRDLSQALKDFTNKAEDVAKFVIYTDLNNYVEPVDKKPLGLFGALKRIWLGKDVPVKNDNIRNFVKDKLPNPALEKAAEYTNILRKINLLKERLDTLKEILDSRRSEKEEHKPHKVSLESRTTSKQKESASNRMKKIKRPTTAPPPPPTAPNELKPEPQKKVATTEKKKVRFKSKPEIISFDDSGYGSLSDEESDKKISNYQEKESIYATVPKEHIEAKRASKQQQQSKPPIPPKPSVIPPVSKKISATDQEARQKPKKDKPEIPPKPKSADQQVSMKPRIVGVTPKKSAESKPTVPLKSESQGRRQSAQKVADKAAPAVKVVAMKEEVNSKKDGRVKSMVGKIEQEQAAARETTPVAQADIGVKKDSPKATSQSHSFPAGNERSEMNPITAKSDPKPPVSKKPLLTHVSVKEIAARFESHGKK